MLNSFLPVALVAAPVAPVHFTVTVPHVIKVLSFVYVSACPSKYPVSALFIVRVGSFVLIRLARASLPDSISVPQSVFKVSFKEAAIRPKVLSVSRWLSIDVIANIQVSICKLFCTFAML